MRLNILGQNEYHRINNRWSPRRPNLYVKHILIGDASNDIYDFIILRETADKQTIDFNVLRETADKETIDFIMLRETSDKETIDFIMSNSDL